MNRNINILWLVVIIPISIFIGYITNSYYFFDISKEINLIELANLLVSIFIVFYFSYHLQKQMEKDKIEKDFIINKMLPFLKECEFLKNSIENNNLNRTKINNSLKEISNTIYYSVKFSNICGKKLREEELRKSQIEIKKSITGGELKHNKYVLQDNSAINKLQNFEEKIISEIVRVNKI